MALLQSPQKSDTVTVTGKFSASLKAEVDAYIDFAELHSVNEFLRLAVERVLAEDKAFKRWRKQHP